jgi:hypothetical protein
VPPLKTGIITTICKIEVYIENFRTRHSSVGNCVAISSSAALEQDIAILSLVYNLIVPCERG